MIATLFPQMASLAVLTNDASQKSKSHGSAIDCLQCWAALRRLVSWDTGKNGHVKSECVTAATDVTIFSDAAKSIDESTSDGQTESRYETEVQVISYKDRHEAMAEVTLEGGEGTGVFFAKVRSGSRSEAAGLKSNDVLVQINSSDPAILFWKPAEEILPTTMGPVSLKWKSSPPDQSSRTRIHSRRPRDWEELKDHGLWSEFAPKSKATGLGNNDWFCGACGGHNRDSQEHCRRCGFRDTRLPLRPGHAPRRNVHYTESTGRQPSLLQPSDAITDKDIKLAAERGFVPFNRKNRQKKAA
jgi:hypothetical protein